MRGLLMARCGCDSGACACVVQGGDNVTVTGTGSVETPYTISATGGASYSPPDERLYAQASAGHNNVQSGGWTVTWGAPDTVGAGLVLDGTSQQLTVVTTGIYAVQFNWQATLQAPVSDPMFGHVTGYIQSVSTVADSDLDHLGIFASTIPFYILTNDSLPAGGIETIVMRLQATEAMVFGLSASISGMFAPGSVNGSIATYLLARRLS
jgi:hypothetical protein